MDTIALDTKKGAIPKAKVNCGVNGVDVNSEKENRLLQKKTMRSDSCMICMMAFEDVWLLGPLKKDDTNRYAVHSNCVKFSPSDLLQERSKFGSGIFGYSLKNILYESRRPAKLVSL